MQIGREFGIRVAGISITVLMLGAWVIAQTSPEELVRSTVQNELKTDSTVSYVLPMVSICMDPLQGAVKL